MLLALLAVGSDFKILALLAVAVGTIKVFVLYWEQIRIPTIWQCWLWMWVVSWPELSESGLSMFAFAFVEEFVILRTW